MINFIRFISIRILLILNIVVAILFIACCLAPNMHPQNWWFTGFLGLFFPYLFILMCLFLLGWLFVKPIWALLPFVVILIGIIPFTIQYSFRLKSDFKAENKKDLRVMTWNVRHFIPFDEAKFKPDENLHQKQIFEEIQKYQPDVICFQEFLSMPHLQEMNPFRLLKKKFGYKYAKFSGQEIFSSNRHSGIAIFSRLPILDGGHIPFPPSEEGNAETTMYADIKKGNDTIRIFSVHLQSFAFGNREYRVIDELKNKSSYDVKESTHLLKKMRNTFYWHGIQSDFVKGKMNESPYPVILAGDLNDVPNSYAYTKVKGDMKDAFLEKGVGLGETFTSATSSILRILPTLRIDYIFADNIFETTQFMRGGKKISDHLFLISDFNIK